MAKRNKRWGNPTAKQTLLNQTVVSRDNSGSRPIGQSFTDKYLFLISVLLFVLVAWVFSPALRGDFIQFDDGMVTQDAHVNTGLTFGNMTWFFWNTPDDNWIPLTWWSHMLDCQLYGLTPSGHHLTNVLIHALNTVLLFLLLQKLTGAGWRSLIVAVLFGLHPLRVESVAWISERKDVLSVMFWMLTLWVYAKFVEASKFGNPKSKIFYGLSLILFACGLMSKPMVVTLPCVLLLLDCWPLERWKQKNILSLVTEKWPFFLLAGIVAVITYIAQKRGGMETILDFLTPSLRLENALVSYVRYLGKLVWPTHLCALYPYPMYWPKPAVLFAGFLIMCISIFAFIQRRQRPYLSVGWLWFLGTLVPVIGLTVQAGTQSMADRYSYFPCIGILIVIVWAFYELSNGWRYRVIGSGLVVSALVLACILLTRNQIGYWKDGLTVWKRAIDVTQNNFDAHDRFGLALLTEKRFDEAFREFEEAVEIKPDDPNANYFLAGQLARQGLIDEAMTHYQRSLKIQPDNPWAEYGLGGMFFQKGQYAEAVVHLRKAAEHYNYDASIQNDFGVALLRNGQLDEAINRFKYALMLAPDYATAHTNLDGTLRLKTRMMFQTNQPTR